MISAFSRRLQRVLRFVDLFSYSSFIRYKGQAQFKTATGGFFSIVVIIIFAVLFTNLGIKTVRRQIISSSFKVDNAPEPTNTLIKLDPHHFMFSVGILGINFNDPTKRWFDVSMTQLTFTSGYQFKSSQNIELQACTPQHFSNTQSMKKGFIQNPLSVNWLCPKIGTSFQVQGKFSSKLLSYVSIKVKKCNPALDLTRPCVPDSDIQALQLALGKLSIALFFSNPLINAGDQQYLDYYFSQYNYMSFSTQLGVESSIYLQDYEIITDNSILPYDSKTSDTGVRIQQAFKNRYYMMTSDTYVDMMIFKSSTSTTFQRSFYKIDQFFSYIGGLVGVILSGMFLLASYNQFSFQHDIATYLYKKDASIESPNLWVFFKQFIFSIFSRFFPAGKFQSMEKSKKLREQMEKQLDLRRILSRILFLERSVQKLFDKGQFQTMHLLQKYTLQQSRKMRKNMNLCSYFNKKIEQINIGSYSSLNEGELAGVTLQKSTTSINNRQQNYDNKSDEEDDQSSIDSDVQSNMKIWGKQFKDTLKQRNQRSVEISSQIEQKYLKFFIDDEMIKQLNGSFDREISNGQIYSQVFVKKAENKQLQMADLGRPFQFIDS